MRFESRTAVITGGAIGFGRAFARALVAEGAGVVIADVDVDMAERTAAELVSAGGQAIAVDCDVLTDGDAERKIVVLTAAPDTDDDTKFRLTVVSGVYEPAQG